jgi:hypothetical protein
MRRSMDELRAEGILGLSASDDRLPLSRRSWLTALLACAGSTLWTSLAAAEADTSYAAREEAEQAIPFDELKPELRARVLAIVDRPSIYRRLPVQSVTCDHDLHVFVVRHPEVVVNIWRLMGITTMQAQRTGKFVIEGDDGAGTVSRIELVYGRPDLHLFHCTGTYEGPLFRRKLSGRSVLLLRSRYGTDRHNHPVVTDQLDVFLQVDNIGADLVAKTMQQSVGKTIDINFSESLKFLNRIYDSAERNGPGMQNLAAKLTDCTPSVRDQFSETCAVVHSRAAERLASLTAPRQFTPDGKAIPPAARR